MWYLLKEWPRLLLTLPLAIRLGIVTVCSLLCMAIHLLTFPVSHNGSLVAVPVGLAAWIFKRRGLVICSVWEVEDEGPGIPQDELPLLFEQFVRLKRDVGGKVRGSGLGLYVSKHLVEAMGGRMWVESAGTEGRGSRFCLTLPALPPRPGTT